MVSSFPPPPRPAGNVDGASVKKQRRFVAACMAVLGFFVASIFMWFTWIVHSLNEWSHVENRNPTDVFKRVFKAPPPTGVTEIKAAGESSLGGGSYWMVVRTSDFPALMAVLTKNVRSTDRSTLDRFEPSGEQLKTDSAAADWESAHHVKNPLYYESGDTGGGPYYGLVVDRARRCVYVGVGET